MNGPDYNTCKWAICENLLHAKGVKYPDQPTEPFLLIPPILICESIVLKHHVHPCFHGTIKIPVYNSKHISSCYNPGDGLDSPPTHIPLTWRPREAGHSPCLWDADLCGGYSRGPTSVSGPLSFTAGGWKRLTHGPLAYYYPTHMLDAKVFNRNEFHSQFVCSCLLLFSKQAHPLLILKHTTNNKQELVRVTLMHITCPGFIYFITGVVPFDPLHPRAPTNLPPSHRHHPQVDRKVNLKSSQIKL